MRCKIFWADCSLAEWDTRFTPFFPNKCEKSELDASLILALTRPAKCRTSVMYTYDGA
jgi:hypothetical protein